MNVLPAVMYVQHMPHWFLQQSEVGVLNALELEFWMAMSVRNQTWILCKDDTFSNS